MARDRIPQNTGGSKAKLIVVLFIGLGTLAIIALAINLWLRKPDIVVKVEDPRNVIENLKRKARNVHRAKEYDEAIVGFFSSYLGREGKGRSSEAEVIEVGEP